MKTFILFIGLICSFFVYGQDIITTANDCYNNKKYQCAIDNYKKAIDLKKYQVKDYATILFRIGYGYSELEKTDDAFIYVRRALAENTNHADANWLLAGLYYRTQEYQSATEVYTKTLKVIGTAPSSLKSLYYWRGRCYLKTNKDSLALIDLKEAIRIDSSVANYYVYAGEASYGLRKYDDAIEYYRKSIQLGDADKKVISARYYWVAKSFFQQRKYEDALSGYKKALEFNPENKSAQWDLGGVYYNQRKWPLAISEYSKAIQFYKDDTASLKHLYYYRGYAYNRNKEYAKALADFDATLKITPNDRDAIWEKALVYYYQKKYREAIPHFNKAIDLFKGRNYDQADLYYYRGMSHLGGKDTASAKSDFLQSVALDYLFAEPTIQLGHISFAEKKYYTAKDYYADAIYDYFADSTEMSLVYFRKGLSNLLAGNSYFQTAKDDMRKSIAYDSANKDAHRYMADVYYRQKYYSLAETELDKCIHLFRTDKDSIPKMYIYRGLARWQQKKYKGALEDYEQSDKLKKFDDPDNVKSMGQLAFEVKEYNKAYTIFSRLVPLYKSTQKDELVFAYFARGRSALELKKKQEAVADLKKASEMSPTSSEIKTWLTKAEALP